MTQEDKLISVRIEEDIAWLCMDVQGEKMNTLSSATTARMEEIMDGLRREEGLRGAVLYSGKKDFIVGFDIGELEGFTKDSSELEGLLERGHALMAQIAELGIPLVAAIHGNCLGGGLEVALACHGRVASQSPTTTLGLPEVMLGLIPGAGGTQRLPRAIDLQLALDMILTGRQLDASRAGREGLVDAVVHESILLEAAASHARKLYDEMQEGKTRNGGVWGAPGSRAVRVVAATPARALIFNKAREQVLKKTGGHYPAPLAAIDVVETGIAQGLEAGLAAEARAFRELIETDAAKNLIHLFFSKNEVEKDPVVSRNVKPRDVQKIGVLGPGLMGAGITQLCAYHGYQIRLKGRDYEGLGWGLNYTRELLDKLVSRRRLTQAEADIIMGRISTTIGYEGIATCDLVIEAVFEDLELKQAILADVEALGNRGLIFASNTSTIPIAKIAENAARPQNVLGMHYFSPVHRMPLLEIIRHEKTTQTAVATALEVGRKTGKTCIVVNDGPGFFTSRVIGAYINEAGWILQEGSSIDGIDKAMTRWGFPVGPMKLVDEVGIDVGVKAASVLQDAFKDRWDQPTALRAIAEEGRAGRKNKKGLYLYGKGKSGVDASVYDLLPGGQERNDLDHELIQQRCWLAMLNECAYCLEDGIISNPRDGDIGVIFGLGFPPFRGGIFRHADTVGLDRIVEQLERLADRFGKRLTPAPILVEKAKKSKTFYSD